MDKNEVAVLFVCLGNICRSPLAEGIFRHQVQQAGLSEQFLIDSCGTGSWHVGAPPHRDSIRVANKFGVSLAGQRARQLCSSDFSTFDLILAMDQSNLRDIKFEQSQAERSQQECEVRLIREFDHKADSLDVPDPYYGGPDGFELVYQMLERSCSNLLQHLHTEPLNNV